MSLQHWNPDGGAALAADPANKDRRGVWDIVYLGGRAMPGVAEVTVAQGRKIDDKGSPGRNGARLVDKGSEAAKVTIRIRVWTLAQLAELQRSMPSLNYREERRTTTRVLGVNEEPTVEEIVRAARASTSPQYRRAQGDNLGASTVGVIRAPTRTETRTRRSRQPLAISHPNVVLANITFVYVEKVNIEGPKDGVLEVRLDCLEYNADVQRPSSSTAPRPRANNTDFAAGRTTAFDSPSSGQPASTTPATPPSRRNAGP